MVLEIKAIIQRYGDMNILTCHLVIRYIRNKVRRKILMDEKLIGIVFFKFGFKYFEKLLKFDF